MFSYTLSKSSHFGDEIFTFDTQQATFRDRLADTSQERFHQRINVNKTGVFVKHKYP